MIIVSLTIQQIENPQSNICNKVRDKHQQKTQSGVSMLISAAMKPDVYISGNVKMIKPKESNLSNVTHKVNGEQVSGKAPKQAKSREVSRNMTKNEKQNKKREKLSVKPQKPALALGDLVLQAINSSPQKQLTQEGIYQFISNTYPYYKQDDEWKVSQGSSQCK